LYEIGGINDNNISEIFYHLYPDLFIYDRFYKISDCKTLGAWFMYDDNGIYQAYPELHEAIDILSSKIYPILYDDFNNRLFELTTKMKENKPNKQGIQLTKKEQNKIIDNFKNKWANISSKLCNTHNQNNILAQLRRFYRKDHVILLMDEVNQQIIGFKNGVYDLSTRSFRKADPSEYVLSTTGYNYAPPEKKYVD